MIAFASSMPDANSTTAQPDNISRIVMLTYGRMQDGNGSYWCYVAVKPSQYDRFMARLKAGTLDLHHYEEDGFGEIIISGPGLLPPPEVTRDVAKMFKANVKELFTDADPQSAIARKIDALKKKAENPTGGA